MMLDVVESLAGMVSSMLEFPLVGFLGGLLPGAGSEAGQQVATALGTGIDNLGSVCSQAGLDRWELLGLAVLSAITVYRKELSSNSVYSSSSSSNSDKKGVGDAGYDSFRVVQHADGCPSAEGGGSEGNPCPCARIGAREQDAQAARRMRAGIDEHKLRRLVEGRMRSLDLPVHHLQQLRASVDASWSSFSTAWEARRARGSGASTIIELSATGGGGGADGNVAAERATVYSGDFAMPRCSHASSHATPSLLHQGDETATTQGSAAAGPEMKGCVECAALAAAHDAAANILRNVDGTVGLLELDDVWAESDLGALPAVTLQKSLSFLAPQDLLTLAQVSTGARQAADADLVWREAWVARNGVMWESDVCREASTRWHLHGWDPRSSAVPQSWKVFFSEFELSWLAWVAAGKNSEASCMVGLHGRLYDITDFMHSHPGSPETLMDNAGADATDFFEDVGHSLDARSLMKTLHSIAPVGISATDKDAKARGAACILVSVADRFRRERLRAQQSGRGLQCGGAAGPIVQGTGFQCVDCEGAFEPTDLDGDGVVGRERRATCSHKSGTLRVFYSPMRGEWCGFYSCCRKHVLLS